MTIPVRQSRFDGGEISRLWYARTDSPKHASGARQLRNFIPLPQGPVTARPGQKFVTYPKTTPFQPGSLPVRLISFTFSDAVSYVLELGNGYIRFIRNGAYVMLSGVPYEGQTQFSNAILPYLKFAQVGDTIVFTYGGQAPGFPALNPYVLRYLGPTSWTLLKQPVAPNLLPDLASLIVTGGTPSVFIRAWLASVTYNMGDTVTSGGQLWVSIQDTNLNNTPGSPSLFWTAQIDTSHLPIQTTFAVTATYLNNTTGEAEETNVLGTFDYRGPLSLDRTVLFKFQTVSINASYSFLFFSFYQGNNGIYGYRGDSPYSPGDEGAEYTYDGTAPDFTRQPPPTPTALGPFNVNGTPDLPAVVNYFEQRRYFARMASRPHGYRASKQGDFLRFDQPVPGNPSSDALDEDLNSENIEDIRSFVGLRTLLAMTGQGEWSIRGDNGTAIEVDSIDQKRQSKWGSSWLDPVVVGNGLIFNTAKSNMVRDFFPMYGLYTDNWSGEDLTAYARDLFDNHTIISWAFQSTPYQILWIVRDDGVLLSLTYDHDKQISGWARHNTGQADKYESVCVVPEPPNDAVYFVVNRNGVRTIEEQEPLVQSPDIRYAGYLDCATLYDGHNGKGFGAPDGSTTVYLSGSTFNALDPVTIHANAALFNTGMFGTWLVLDPDNAHGGPVAVVITGYTDAQTVTGELQAPLSVAQQVMWVASRTTAWAIAYRSVSMQNPGNAGLDTGVAQFPIWTSQTAYGPGLTVVFPKQGTSGVWTALLGSTGVVPGSDFATWQPASTTGRGIAVLADGATQTGLGTPVMSGGVATVALAQPAVVVKVGLSYNCDLETLDLIMPQVEQRDRYKRVVRAGFELAQARGIWTGSSFTDVLNEWEQGQVTDGAIPPLDTDFVEVLLSTGFDKNGRMVLRHFDPLPLTVLGILREVELGGS